VFDVQDRVVEEGAPRISGSDEPRRLAEIVAEGWATTPRFRGVKKRKEKKRKEKKRKEKKRKEAVHLPMRNVRRGEVDEA
jgi:hypothetical protein